MSHTFPMKDLFGTMLADGVKGNEFRMCVVEPALHENDLLVFDFNGVENMTDSFANGCFANFARNHAREIRKRVRFQGCTPLVRDFLCAALSRGFREAAVMGTIPASSPHQAEQ